MTILLTTLLTNYPWLATIALTSFLLGVALIISPLISPEAAP